MRHRKNNTVNKHGEEEEFQLRTILLLVKMYEKMFETNFTQHLLAMGELL